LGKTKIMFVSLVKNFLKKHFYILRVRHRFTPSVQIQQVQLLHYYKDCQRNKKLPHFNDTGFKVFSQFEEDGKLLYIFSLIGMGDKTFVDLGSHDGINSNCANLALNFGWKGLFIDGDKTVIGRGRRFYKKYPDFWSYKPIFLHAFITKSNINSLLEEHHFRGPIDLLSIDIDGNDYWIWEALEAVRPKVVVIESQVAFGAHDIAAPYREDFNSDPGNNLYSGASNFALNTLARKKGYRLIGSNEYGNNLFFLQNGIADEELPEIDVASTLQHPFATEKFLDMAQLQKSNLI
jgi:hypothetical protein